MRIFSISIEDRILRMPAGEGGEGGGTGSGGGADTEEKKSQAMEKQNNLQDQANKKREKEIEQQDAIYERIVGNIAKAKERFEIDQQRFDLLKQESLMLQNQLTLGESQLNQLNRIANDYEKLLKFKKDDEVFDQAKFKSLQNEIKAEENVLKNMAKKLGIELKIFKTAYNIDTQEEERILNISEINELSEENLATLKEYQKASEADKSRMEKAIEAQKKIDGVGKKILDNTVLSADAGETILGQYEGIFQNLQTISGGKGLALGLKMMKNTFKSAFNLKNVLYKAAEFSYDLAKQIEKVSKDLGTATGFGNQFANQIRLAGDSLTMIGGDEQSASEMIKTMVDNISSFNPEADKMNTKLATSLFKLKQFGVNASTSAKAIDRFEKALGMTAEKSVEAVAQLAITGRQLGISTEEMVSNFGTAYERVTAFGTQGKVMFKELSAQIKATGIEMNRLLDIAKKYDTFEGAAKQVGQLNAVLGTNLSTLEMLNATDSERIEIIRREVRSSVGNFDNLGKYEKMYIQQAMGVNSLEEAQRLLNMSQADYLKNQSKQQEAANAQAELAKNASELVPALTKLTNLILKFFKLFKPFMMFFMLIGRVIDVIFSSVEGWTADTEDFSIAMMLLRDAVIAVAIAWAFFTGVLSFGVATLLGTAAGLGAIYEIATLPGSRPMNKGMFDKDIGASFDRMANSMSNATSKIDGTSDSLNNLYDSVHKTGGSKIDITAMAKMDTGKIASGVTAVKSALMELSTLKIDGFIAMATDGTKTSFAMASEGVIKSLSEGKLLVDINMPELTLPPINVIIESKGTNLTDFIDARIEKKSTGT